MSSPEELLRTALTLGRMTPYESELPEYLANIHPDDRAHVMDALAALSSEQPEAVYEYRHVLADAVRWMRDAVRVEFGSDGKIARVRGLAADITEMREAEARLNLIAAVSEWIGASDDAAELLYEVSRAIGEHLHARRVLFTEIDLDNDRGIVRRDYCRGVPSVAGVYKVSDYAETTRREMQAGRTVVNDDSQADPRTSADYEKTYAPAGERAYVAVPLLRDGRWVAELWVSDDRPRRWPPQDVALLVSIAERVWTAVEKLRVNAALRESEERMQFVGEHAEVGYWYWDIRGDRLYWSNVCHRLHGIPENEPLTYARYLEAMHPDDRGAVDRLVRAALLAEGPNEYEIEARTVWPDGTVRWIHGKGSASFADGKPVRMAGIALDITQRKLLELERERILTVEREANRAKDHFLALLSHELRTPMTTIVGWASFIRSGMADAATAQKGIESIEQASHTQARLIDDLLDVSRIVTGKMVLDRKLIDVTEPVRAAMQMIEPAAHAASIRMTSDLGAEPVFIAGDSMRLQQVVWNLLSNAVKFTPAGGHVHVYVAPAGEAVEIRVRDNGVGIDSDFLPHVFARFRQAESGPARRFGGLGLGLSIARYLTELHDGTIAASSEGRDRGSEFIVRLPCASGAPALHAPLAESRIDRSALRNVRVLLVDDDPAAREVLGTILEGFGASVTHAASAAEAVQCFHDTSADVLVSDIGMPDEDGYALIRRLRESSAVPAVAVTAYADPIDRARALNEGFQAHLAKPVEPQALAAAVLRVLPRQSEMGPPQH